MFPATTQASKDTPKEERRRVPSYDESIQGHPRKKEGEERKERKKERKTERKKERKKDRKTERKKERKREGEKGRGEKMKKAGVPSYEQSSRDTPKKERGDPEYSIQENPRKQRKKGGGKGKEGGLSSRQVPMNLKLALTAMVMVTLCLAKMAGCFDRCGHVKP